MRTHRGAPNRIQGLRVLVSLVAGLALAAGLQAPPAEAASKATTVKALIKKVLGSKNPKATYSNLSKAKKALIKKELKGGKTVTRWIQKPINPNVNAVPAGLSEYCDERSSSSTVYGGITKAPMFTVVHTARVCVQNRWVTSVTVPMSYVDNNDLGGVGWHPDATKDYTRNVGWEGRASTRGSMWWGVAEWRLLERSECVRSDMNADSFSWEKSSTCTLT